MNDTVPSYYETYKEQFDYLGLAVSYGNFGIRRVGSNKYTALYEHDKNWETPMELYYSDVRRGLKKQTNMFYCL